MYSGRLVFSQVMDHLPMKGSVANSTKSRGGQAESGGGSGICAGQMVL